MQEIIEVPLVGKIVSVDVKVGDKVKEGDTLCVLEAMKMENPIVAPADGTITEIKVAAEQTVDGGDLIAIIEYQ